MLFAILNIFFTIIIIILFVRYFVEPYQYYGFGPIMVAIVQLTERLMKPIRTIFPRKSSALQDHSALIAILVTVLLRGLAIRFIGTGGSYHLPMMQGWLFAMSSSFTMAVLLLVEMLVAFLFASWMMSRRGVNMGSNGAFMCFRERTFSIFRYTKKYVKTEKLHYLFLASTSVLVVTGSVVAALTSLSFLFGAQAFLLSIVIAFFAILSTLIILYWFVLLLAILASWIGADQYSAIVQIVRSMADPYLKFFSRIMPWARIDFIDLSPIFGFLLLNPVLWYLLQMVQAYLQAIILNSAIFA